MDYLYPGNVIRNGIDYILINHRIAVKSVKTYPVGSDHNILVAEIVVRLKVSSKQRLIDSNLLRSNNVRMKVHQEVNENLTKLESRTT